MKEYKKLIIGIIIGAIIASCITVYAYSYVASEVKYTNEKSVADALNDLYNKSANYVLPTGTKTITEKANNIDVSKFKYVDTTSLYTSVEATTGKGVNYNTGTTTITNGNLSIPVGFTPSKIWVEYDCSEGVAVSILYGTDGSFFELGCTDYNDKKSHWVSKTSTGAIYSFDNSTNTWNIKYANWNGSVNWCAIK